LGTAYRIALSLLMSWSLDEVDTEAAERLHVDIDFVYVEPGHTTGIELGRIRANVRSFGATVSDVTYEDVFGFQRLTDRHGALTLVYDGKRREVRNEREVKLGR
jgi:hypothetical protein